MEQETVRQFRGYLVTCIAVAAAGLLIRLLQAGGYAGFSPLFAALIISAWYGGIGPASLGIVLATLAAYYLLPKANDGQLYREDFLRATIFTLTAMVAVAVHLASRRTEEAAKRDKRAAEQANEAKTRLLAMVTHDLQGPLNPILMAIAVAESDPVVAERAREPLKLIRNGVAEEARLIEDLLDVARLITGKFKVHLAHADIHHVIEKAVVSCQDRATEKRIEIHIEHGATLSQVNGDVARLHQVFWNLLNNAIKFTPEDGMVALRTFDASAGQIGVEVRDNGLGISPEKLPSIFTIFEQGGAAITARFGGLGLGLTICQGIVEAHGGSITASSAGEGRGATFVVRLPTAANRFPDKFVVGNDADKIGRYDRSRASGG